MKWMSHEELKKMDFEGWVYTANPHDKKVRCVYKRICNTYFDLDFPISQINDCLFSPIFMPDFPHEKFEKEDEYEYWLYETKEKKEILRGIVFDSDLALYWINSDCNYRSLSQKKKGTYEKNT